MCSKKYVVSLLLLITMHLITGCATPVRYTSEPMESYDKNTKYVIEEIKSGFSISVYYSRYQFIPESDAVAVSCKSQLKAIAWEHADEKNRKIEPLNEQRIKISMGRNELTGITSCSANVSAKWEK